MSQSNEITHDYNGTIITYDEGANLWRFTLRDRDRNSPSLAQAKEAIDKPVPQKEKPFVRFEVWWIPYSSDPTKATVTGIAEQKYGDDAVWISGKSGRQKVKASEIVQCSPDNDAVVAQAVAHQKESNRLDDLARAAYRSLPKYKVTPEA